MRLPLRRLRLLSVLAVLGLSMPLPAQQPTPGPEVAAPAAKARGPLNFAFDGTPAADAFKQLAEAANLNIKADPQVLFDADPIFLKVENGYFWPTLFEMAKQAKLSFQPYGRGGSRADVELDAAGRGYPSMEKMPRCDADGFVLILQHMSYSRNISFFSERSQRSAHFAINGMLFVDPGKRVLQFMQPIITEAVDEKGNSYAPPANAGPSPMMMGGGQSALIQNCMIPLAGEPRGEKLVSLKGKARLKMVAEEKLITIDDLSTLPTTVTAGSQQIKIEANPANMIYTLVVTITGSDDTQQDGWAKMAQISITDADGRALSYSGGSSSGGRNPGGGEAPLNLRANFSGASAGAGPAKRLVWHYTLRTEMAEVPFSFTNLPLP